MQNLYIGVDVGSGSVRAGLFDTQGNKLAMSSTGKVITPQKETQAFHDE